MPQSVRIDDLLVNTARDEIKGTTRSVQSQIEHWAKIGQMVELSGVFSYSQIKGFLSGEMSMDSLSNEERLIASRSVFEQISADDFSSVTDELKSRGDEYYGMKNGKIAVYNQDDSDS